MRFVAVTMLALALVASATAAEAKRRPAPAIAGITLDGKQVAHETPRQAGLHQRLVVVVGACNSEAVAYANWVKKHPQYDTSA